MIDPHHPCGSCTKFRSHFEAQAVYFADGRDMTILDEVGAAIRARREEKGFTQAKLADIADVSRRHVAAVERGANVSLALLVRIATALDLNDLTVGSLTLHVPSDGRGAASEIAEAVDDLAEAQRRIGFSLARLKEWRRDPPT